jgi:membrane protease YdiL (CAAX protease family)
MCGGCWAGPRGPDPHRLEISSRAEPGLPGAKPERPVTSPIAPTHPVAVAVVTTAAVTALSYALPDDLAATGVGLGFLLVVHRVVLRGASNESIGHFGLALGGLLESEPLRVDRLIRAGLGALGWAALLALILFPPFWLGWLWWYQPRTPCTPVLPDHVVDEVLGQLLVIALPEEAFYRGYLQRALDDRFAPRLKLFGAELGWGVLVSSLFFALGHLLTEPQPGRLAVFFPALVFCWLRARTGGIGASLSLHALSNLFASFLAASYGLGG